jgi:hypothetical protein
MGEFMVQEEISEILLPIYTYCDKNRNYARNWDQIFESYGSDLETSERYEVCYEGLQENTPGKYSPLREEISIVVNNRIIPNNKLLHCCFLIVNNKGYLFGDNDREQRL